MSDVNDERAKHHEQYESFVTSPFMESVQREAVCRIVQHEADILAMAAKDDPSSNSKRLRLAHYVEILEEVKSGSFWRDAFRRRDAEISKLAQAKEQTEANYDSTLASP